jgi:isoaspartyl peptidase/L-asparaginase-like protein (Ntn-hydrolase superfamily)
MTNSPHVLLCGAGADTFAAEHQCEQVPNSYFDTKRRRKQLEYYQKLDAAKQGNKSSALTVSSSGSGAPAPTVALDHTGASLLSTQSDSKTPSAPAAAGASDKPEDPTKRNGRMIGTVGAVALDTAGNLGTSFLCYQSLLAALKVLLSVDCWFD